MGFSLWDLAPSARLAPRRGLDLSPLREQARQRFDSPPKRSVAPVRRLAELPEGISHLRPKAMTAAGPGAGSSADQSFGPVTCSKL